MLFSCPVSPTSDYSRLHALSNPLSKSPHITEGEIHEDEGHNKSISRLGRWTITRSAMLVVELIFSLAPLLFIVIAILVANLNGKPTSGMGKNVERIIPFLPTIFPILFAALMGKFFKALALYRAERGVLLGNLERLMGCQSLFGSIERQISLRHLDAIGAAIVIAWTLSPIGGQSALRLMSRAPRIIDFNTTLRYLPVEAAKYSWLTSEIAASEGWPSYAPIYMAALRTTRTQSNSTIDLWGNVKIPDIEDLEKNGTTTHDGWVSVNQSSEVSYSSLLGIPVVGLPETGNSTFNLASRYWKIDCTNLTYIANYTDWEFSWLSSFQFQRTGLYGNLTAEGITYFNMISLLNYMTEDLHVSSANCSLALRDVESSISCQDRNCQVNAMRPSTIPVSKRSSINGIARSTTWSELPFAAVGYKSHAAEGAIQGSTPTEQWIANPDTDFSDILSYANLSALDPKDLSDRLQIVYNTFWQATYGMQYLVGNLTTQPLTNYDNAPLNGALGNVSFNTTTAQVSQVDGEIYVWHLQWALLLIVTSSLLLFAGLASLVLKARTLAPDILGYASTCVRDNPYALLDDSEGEVPKRRSHFDGLEQARALKGVKVMIGDVRGNDEVGHVAFATMAVQPQSLTKARLYD